MKPLALILLVLLLAVATVLAIAALRWRRTTADLVSRLRGSAGPATDGRTSHAELGSLPPPVARYLRIAVPDGRPPIRAARLIQEGEFLLRPTPDGWRPFRATHHLVTRPPGFVWDARIRMGPGLAVHVRDGLVEGAGHMWASVMGLVTLVDQHGTPDLTAGALHRYLAEAVWAPTALLPSAGVAWTSIDDTSARATLRSGATSVSLDFRFGRDGLVESVFTLARMRDVEGRGVPTPWQGRFAEYDEREGYRIPLRGDVEWLLPEGPRVYWRGRITAVEYDLGNREAVGGSSTRPPSRPARRRKRKRALA